VRAQIGRRTHDRLDLVDQRIGTVFQYRTADPLGLIGRGASADMLTATVRYPARTGTTWTMTN
jgi:hypothetical protein